MTDGVGLIDKALHDATPAMLARLLLRAKDEPEVPVEFFRAENEAERAVITMGEIAPKLRLELDRRIDKSIRAVGRGT